MGKSHWRRERWPPRAAPQATAVSNGNSFSLKREVKYFFLTKILLIFFCALSKKINNP
jgi:hypothetical protein